MNIKPDIRSFFTLRVLSFLSVLLPLSSFSNSFCPAVAFLKPITHITAIIPLTTAEEKKTYFQLKYLIYIADEVR